MSLGNGNLINDINDTISVAFSDSMDRVRDDIVSKVRVEVRAEMARQTDELMAHIGVITAIKSTVELCHTKVSNNSDFLGEIVEAVEVGSTELKSMIEALARDLSTASSNHEAITHARTQLSSISALLTETLKVVQIHIYPPNVVLIIVYTRVDQ